MANDFLAKPFGMNVIIPETTVQHGVRAVKKKMGGLFNPFGEFFEKSRPVLSGDVLEEIKNLNLTTYNIEAGLQDEVHNIDYNS